MHVGYYPELHPRVNRARSEIRTPAALKRLRPKLDMLKRQKAVADALLATYREHYRCLRREHVEPAEARRQAIVFAYQRERFDLLGRGRVTPEEARRMAIHYAEQQTGVQEGRWDETRWKEATKPRGVAIANAQKRLNKLELQDNKPIEQRESDHCLVLINPRGDRVWVFLADRPTDETCQMLQAAGFQLRHRHHSVWRAWSQKYSDEAISAAMSFASLPPGVVRRYSPPRPVTFPPLQPPPPHHPLLPLDGRGIGRAQPAATIGTTPIPQSLGGIGKAMGAPVAPPPQQHGGIARSVSPFTAIQPPPTAPQVVMPLPVTSQPVVSLPVASGPIARPLVAFPPASPLAAPQSVATQLAAPTQAEAPHSVPPPVVPSAGDAKV